MSESEPRTTYPHLNVASHQLITKDTIKPESQLSNTKRFDLETRPYNVDQVGLDLAGFHSTSASQVLG